MVPFNVYSCSDCFNVFFLNYDYINFVVSKRCFGAWSFDLESNDFTSELADPAWSSFGPAWVCPIVF